MIKQLFLPPTIGNRRIFAQKILGCSVDDGKITLAVIHAMRSTTSIDFLTEELVEDGIEPDKVRIAAALKKGLSKAPPFDVVQIAIPASVVIFKELKLPFVDIDKIKMIIEYETEPLLPFSLEESIIDFIITKQENDSSQVLVAAVRIDDLSKILEPYEEAGLTPEKITIDLFALYGLYQQIPQYCTLPHASALVEINQKITRIAFLYHGELRLTRNIQNGFLILVKSIAQELGKDEKEITSSLLTYGLKKTGEALYDTAVEKAFVGLLNDIQFTLNSFSLKLSFYEGINKILFIGSYAGLPEFLSFSTTLLQTSCEFFACEKLFENAHIKNNVKLNLTNWNKHAIALGTALTYTPHASFNLRQKLFATDVSLAHNRILAALILFVFITLGLGIHGYLQVSRLINTSIEIENKEIKNLKTLVPENETLPKKITLKRLIETVETIINNRKEAWKNKDSTNLTAIEILQELTRIIDRKKFNVHINSLIIGAGENATQVITLEGILHSKTGDDAWAHFYLFRETWKNSKILTVTDIVEGMADDATGVKFTAHLKRKEV